MGAQKGRDLLLKIADGASFTTVAGLRARRIAFNASSVDVTHAESAGQWRELLASAGIRQASVGGSGLFKDAASDARMRTAFFDAEMPVFRVVIPDFGVIEGPFQITSLELSGAHDGEVTFDIALESAGLITFAGV